MKKILYVLLVGLFSCACSGNTCYQVFYNGELAEERYYENGILKSIVAHNCSDTKDSIVFDGAIRGFHLINNKYVSNDSMPFYKFYYPDFDYSLHRNEIYSYIDSRILLEGVLWSLASIDNELKTKAISKIITRDASSIILEYQNLDTRCLLNGMFQLFNTEELKNIKVLIKDRALVKLILSGENIEKRILFEYFNGILYKEKIYYYNKGENESCYYEEYSFLKKVIST